MKTNHYLTELEEIETKIEDITFSKAKKKAQRICNQEGCGTILSMYNRSKYCFLHSDPDIISKKALKAIKQHENKSIKSQTQVYLEDVYNLLKEDNYLTYPKIARILDTAPSTVGAKVKQLTKLGLVKRCGPRVKSWFMVFPKNEYKLKG